MIVEHKLKTRTSSAIPCGLNGLQKRRGAAGGEEGRSWGVVQEPSYSPSPCHRVSSSSGPGGALDISSGGEVRPGPSYPDPV